MSRQRDAKGRFVGNTSPEMLAVERIEFARRAGIQYGGDRDLYTVAGYKKDPKYEDYWAYYDRHPIAARIIDMPAQTTWRHAPEIGEPDQEDGTEFTRALDAMVKRLRVWSRMERVDRLARIGEYAVLLIGTSDVATPQQLRQPIGRLGSPDDVLYLTHYSQRSARIETWVTDPADERFGLPELYAIDLSRNNSNFRAGTVLVHWTRCIHVAEDVLEDDVYGRPALRRVFNSIFNDEKVDAASAEAFWQLADKILQMQIDKDVANVDTKAVDEQVRALFHDLRRHISVQGGQLSWLGGDTPDPTGLSEVLATKMAAGAGIPRRILFGSERGELASQQDERNWHGTIAERQKHHAEAVMVRPLVDRLIGAGALPRPTTGEYDVLWQSLYSATEQEIAERNKLVAETAAILAGAGGLPAEYVQDDKDLNLWLRPIAEVMAEQDEQLREAQRLLAETMPDDDTGEDEPEAEAVA